MAQEKRVPGAPEGILKQPKGVGRCRLVIRDRRGEDLKFFLVLPKKSISGEIRSYTPEPPKIEMGCIQRAVEIQPRCFPQLWTSGFVPSPGRPDCPGIWHGSDARFFLS